MEQVLEQAQELMNAGGPVMLVIAGLSVAALAIILVKAGQFLVWGLGNQTIFDRALACWHDGAADQALSVLAGARNPIARTLEIAMRGVWDGTLDRKDLEDTVASDGAARIATLRSHLRLLELIATLSPLLGLLGTVLGMIDAFQALEAAGSRVNPAILSGGIWIALLTTAAGLVVAIPAAAAHGIFDGIAERAAQSLETAATQALTGQGGAQDTRSVPVRMAPGMAS